MFISKFNKSNLITYLGCVAGIISMYFAFSKMAFADIPYLKYSLAFLIIAGVCDMFDGKFARMCKRNDKEKELGIQLDSLADTVNFLCLPVVIMMSLGMCELLHIVVYTLFVICGITRLAHFNTIADANNPVKYYNGLPVTSVAIIYPILGLLHGIINNNTFNIVYLLATFIISILFVLKIKIPKLKGKAYIIIPILASILVILLLVLR